MFETSYARRMLVVGATGLGLAELGARRVYGIRQMGGQRAKARAARLSRSSQIERAVSFA